MSTALPASPVNLFSLNREQLNAFFVKRGEKRFRSEQLMKWMYHGGVLDYALMSDISKRLREQLKEDAQCVLPQVVADTVASDGVRKWALKYGCENSIEVVYIPEDDRGTLCISSQAGCALACPFCLTAHAGFNRNLSAGEIIAQVWLAKKMLGEYQDRQRRISNVVLMGMGEPLLNFDAVMTAVDIMMDDLGFGLSKRRVTLSTSGVVPAIRRLHQYTDLALAVSLHAPNNALRDKIVPINRKYPLEELIPACADYVRYHNQHGGVTWEYVMLKGVNDRLYHARELAELLKDVPGKINLIPFNAFPQSPYACSKSEDMLAFQHYLQKQGFVVTLRKTRGQDIDAACGQLAGKIKDRSRRKQKLFQGMSK